MERLTGKESYCSFVCCDNEDKCKIENVCYDKKLYGKLKEFENLEEQLESIYGECDGLLETAVKSLVKHEGVDFGKPYKARLLTDEDVDKWEEHKDLEEQGLLLKLPYKAGERVWILYKDKLIEENYVASIQIGEKYDRLCFADGYVYTIWNKDYEEAKKWVYTSKAEAEKALAEMGG